MNILSDGFLFCRQSLLQVQKVILMCGIVVLSACTSTEQTEVVYAKDNLFNDQVFAGYEQVALPTEREIFHLGPEATRFIDGIIRDRGTEKSLKHTFYLLFDKAELGLVYQEDANDVANTTFLNRSANCLSLSILTYAMADYAGYQAQMFEVDIPEYWTRRDNVSLLNGHVNLRVSEVQDPQAVYAKLEYMDIDFSPQDMQRYFERKPLNKKEIVAMFYNNRGAESMIKQRYVEAYAYLKAAIATADFQPETWVNLGVLYRKMGLVEASELAYRTAIDIDEEHYTAWENLAYLKRSLGDQRSEKRILDMVSSQRKTNPFYHFILGEQALEQEQFEVALEHYRKALKLHRHSDLIYFGLSKAYLNLGDVSMAKEYLNRARKYAQTLDDKARYGDKLSLLSAQL